VIAGMIATVAVYKMTRAVRRNDMAELLCATPREK
jgi:hypothetical protein